MQNIVFVHGFMNNGQIWRQWAQWFTERGFHCYTPSWPYMDGNVTTLRKHPRPQLKNTDFNDVVNHYAKLIEQLDQTPILIGHSLGGVVVQKLLERGYGRAAVCINSGPPKWILAFNWSFLISNALLVNPFKHDPLVLMDAKWYHRYVTNELSMDETQAFIEQNCLPASKRVAQTIDSIDFHKPHSPLLFIAGDQDRSQPVVINQKNANAYTDEHSVTDFKVFAGRTHNVLAQPGWQAVAQSILNWLQKQA